MKAQTARLTSTKVLYGDFENLNETVLQEDVKLKKFFRKIGDSNENYEFFSYQF